MRERGRAVASEAGGDEDAGTSGSQVAEKENQRGAESNSEGEGRCNAEAAAVGAGARQSRAAEVSFVVPERERRLGGLHGMRTCPGNRVALGPMSASALGLRRRVSANS